MFGCNDSANNSSITPHGKTHKKNVALSFHRVMEAIAANIIPYHFTNGEINPADILSKYWAHRSVWQTLNIFIGKELLWSV